MVCLIDSPMTLSIQPDGQTPIAQTGPQSAIQPSNLVADNLLDSDYENTDFDEQTEQSPFE